jgi:hypothetical protein
MQRNQDEENTTLLAVGIAYLYSHLRPENGERECRGCRGCPDLARKHAEKALAIGEKQG